MFKLQQGSENFVTNVLVWKLWCVPFLQLHYRTRYSRLGKTRKIAITHELKLQCSLARVGGNHFCYKLKLTGNVAGSSELGVNVCWKSNFGVMVFAYSGLVRLAAHLKNSPRCSLCIVSYCDQNSCLVFWFSRGDVTGTLREENAGYRARANSAAWQEAIFKAQWYSGYFGMFFKMLSGSFTNVRPCSSHHSWTLHRLPSSLPLFQSLFRLSAHHLSYLFNNIFVLPTVSHP